jgi:hypothetical protein
MKWFLSVATAAALICSSSALAQSESGTRSGSPPPTPQGPPGQDQSSSDRAGATADRQNQSDDFDTGNQPPERDLDTRQRDSFNDRGPQAQLEDRQTQRYEQQLDNPDPATGTAVESQTLDSTAERSVADGQQRSADNNSRPQQWRYKRHNGEWWYWHPNDYWVYWRDGGWQRYDRTTYQSPNWDGVETGYGYQGGTGRTYTQGQYYDDGYRGTRYSDGYAGDRYYDGRVGNRYYYDDGRIGGRRGYSAGYGGYYDDGYRGGYYDDGYRGGNFGTSREGRVGAGVGGAIGGRRGAAVGRAIGEAID